MPFNPWTGRTGMAWAEALATLRASEDGGESYSKLRVAMLDGEAGLAQRTADNLLQAAKRVGAIVVRGWYDYKLNVDRRRVYLNAGGPQEWLDREVWLRNAEVRDADRLERRVKARFAALGTPERVSALRVAVAFMWSSAGLGFVPSPAVAERMAATGLPIGECWRVLFAARQAGLLGNAFCLTFPPEIDSVEGLTEEIGRAHV